MSLPATMSRMPFLHLLVLLQLVSHICGDLQDVHMKEKALTPGVTIVAEDGTDTVEDPGEDELELARAAATMHHVQTSPDRGGGPGHVTDPAEVTADTAAQYQRLPSDYEAWRRLPEEEELEEGDYGDYGAGVKAPLRASGRQDIPLGDEYIYADNFHLKDSPIEKLRKQRRRNHRDFPLDHHGNGQTDRQTDEANGFFPSGHSFANRENGDGNGEDLSDFYSFDNGRSKLQSQFKDLDKLKEEGYAKLEDKRRQQHIHLPVDRHQKSDFGKYRNGRDFRHEDEHEPAPNDRNAGAAIFTSNGDDRSATFSDERRRDDSSGFMGDGAHASLMAKIRGASKHAFDGVYIDDTSSFGPALSQDRVTPSQYESSDSNDSLPPPPSRTPPEDDSSYGPPKVDPSYHDQNDRYDSGRDYQPEYVSDDAVHHHPYSSAEEEDAYSRNDAIPDFDVYKEAQQEEEDFRAVESDGRHYQPSDGGDRRDYGRYGGGRHQQGYEEDYDEQQYRKIDDGDIVYVGDGTSHMEADNSKEYGRRRNRSKRDLFNGPWMIDYDVDDVESGPRELVKISASGSYMNHKGGVRVRRAAEHTQENAVRSHASAHNHRSIRRTHFVSDEDVQALNQRSKRSPEGVVIYTEQIRDIRPVIHRHREGVPVKAARPKSALFPRKDGGVVFPNGIRRPDTLDTYSGSSPRPIDDRKNRKDGKYVKRKPNLKKPKLSPPLTEGDIAALLSVVQYPERGSASGEAPTFSPGVLHRGFVPVHHISKRSLADEFVKISQIKDVRDSKHTQEALGKEASGNSHIISREEHKRVVPPSASSFSAPKNSTGSYLNGTSNDLLPESSRRSEKTEDYRPHYREYGRQQGRQNYASEEERDPYMRYLPVPDDHDPYFRYAPREMVQHFHNPEVDGRAEEEHQLLDFYGKPRRQSSRRPQKVYEDYDDYRSDDDYFSDGRKQSDYPAYDYEEESPRPLKRKPSKTRPSSDYDDDYDYTESEPALYDDDEYQEDEDNNERRSDSYPSNRRHDNRSDRYNNHKDEVQPYNSRYEKEVPYQERGENEYDTPYEAQRRKKKGRRYPNRPGPRYPPGYVEDDDEAFDGRGEGRYRSSEDDEFRHRTGSVPLKPSKHHADEYEDTQRRVSSIMDNMSRSQREKNCAREVKNGMTCYVCTDDKGGQSEDCAYAGGDPDSRHSGYSFSTSYGDKPDSATTYNKDGGNSRDT